MEIFESGIYTVVLATRADLIPEALTQVGDDRRPAINEAVFGWYAQHMPNASVMVACFNNREAGKVAPPLWAWYRPRNPEFLQAPGIDAHDGAPPNMEARVVVDANIVIGSFRIHEKVGRELEKIVKSDQVPEAFRPFAPKKLRAADFMGRYPNGDYVISVEDLTSEKSTSGILHRQAPPAYAA